MSKDSRLNLPDGILQKYQRRYSDPTPSSSRLFHKPPRPRRFSLTTFDDLKDISSHSVRTRVSKVLHSSGFTQYEKAKTTQARRYSLYADTNVENNLGEQGRRRSSFTDKIKSALSYNIDDNSRKRTHSDVSRKASMPSYWDDKDLEEYQTHLSEVKPSPYRVCDEQYWLSRRCKNVEPSDNFQKIPKCKYKLRTSGAITSELSSAYGVHIQCMDRSCSRNSTCSQSQQPRTRFNDLADLETRPPSNLSCQMYKKPNNSSLKNRPDSAYDSYPRASPVDCVRPRSTSLQWTLADNENFKYSFYNPAKTNDAFTSSSSATPAFSPAQERRSSIDNATGAKSTYHQNKPRRLSNINFEIIGNPSLHGSPNYSGRLKLCTYRSHSFGI